MAEAVGQKAPGCGAERRLQMKTRATQWSFTLDNHRGEGGGHSEELEPLKPSSSERKLEVVEHIDSGDGQFVDESINKFQSDKNSNNLVMESFSEGERLHRIVSCTACGQQVNHFQKDSIYRHPALNVLICKNCYKYYMSENINCNSEGIGEQCRWCAERGNLICCDSCDNAFCKKCISRNLGKKEISKIMDENNQWQCYICHPEPLLDLVAVCDCVFEDISLLRQQNKKKLKSASEKSGKTCNHPPKFYSTTKEEEKPQLDDFHSDAVTHSFSSLMVSKDLITKTETLLENTTVMKSSFGHFQNK
uniref:DNA helicase n=1 Tax=Phascolarctos cinereus TaxID=38626 RepID=A0A6P5JX88_PHACI|nr:transcriptional regulator ATRX-like [Phascolarctos cinereus]